jgi:hypothetical protein
MAFKVLAIITVVTMLTACREQQRSLPINHAADSSRRNAGQKPPNPHSPGPMQEPRIDVRRITSNIYKNVPAQYCYSFILKRPRDQRASAVQARLEQADRMTAAIDPNLLAVDLIGNHANILSLEFPVVWPAGSYVSHVSSIVDEYFASVDIEDYMCNAGFAEVRLSARGLIDQRIHAVWTARVTSEGLLKSTGGVQMGTDGSF